MVRLARRRSSARRAPAPSPCLVTIRRVNTGREYYSQRHRRGPHRKPLDLSRLKQLSLSVFSDFSRRGYFQEAFGYSCVDDDEAHGTVGPDPNAFFFLRLGREELWPLDDRARFYDADTLFDVLELLHDLVSFPVDGRYHSYFNCGLHYDTFDGERGQAEFRAVLNPVLARYDPPLEMNASGEIIQAIDPGLGGILAADLPTDTEPVVQERLSAAVELFQSRNVTPDGLRRCVTDLAGVLEHLRRDVKAVMPSADEDALFNIANNFVIRHLNDRQKPEYDRPTWLRWTFYVYLASIHLVVRLRERPDPDPPSNT